MHLKRELKYSDLDGRVVFWTGGNRPTQEVFHLKPTDVADGLKASFLLADTVVASASYYLESDATRAVAKRLAPLFAQGSVLFFVDENIESFVEHGARKVDKSPKTLNAYSQPEIVAKKAKELEDFGFLLRRPADSISALLVERWERDLTSVAADSLGAALDQLTLPPDNIIALRIAMMAAAKNRSTDFVWEVVAPVLEKHNAPQAFRRLARARLAGFYGEETAKLLNATVDASDRRLVSDVGGLTDVSLFQRMLFVMEAAGAFHRLNANDCLTVKHSTEWSLFWTFYSKLHTEVGNLEVTELPMFSVFKKAEERWRTGEPQRRGISRLKFLNVVEQLLSGHSRRAARFSKPVDFLLDVCDSIQASPVSDFINLLIETSTPKSKIMPKQRRRKAVGIIVIKPVELDAVKALFNRAGQIEKREGQLTHRRFFEGTLIGHDESPLPAVCLRALDQGNPSAQSACHALLTEYDVRLLVLLGIAGGINVKIRLCDVVVADAVYNYERRSITDAGIKHRLDVYKMSAKISELFGRFMEDYGEEPEFEATLGSANPTFITRKAPIGSGEAVVKNKLAEVRTWLESINENVMAVETEAIGASHVEHELELYKDNKPIGLLIVRGISDHSDQDKNNKYQRLASDNACIILDKVLRSYAPLKQWNAI